MIRAIGGALSRFAGRVHAPSRTSGARVAGAFACLFAAAAAFAAWRLAFDLTLGGMEEEGRLELTFIAGALEKDFARHKLLAKSLAETEVMRRRAESDFAAPAADALLERMEAVSGAERIQFLTAATARTVAERRAVAAAYQGAMGFAFDEARGGSFLLASPVRREAGGGAVLGALAIRLAAADLEWSWRALPKMVFFVGADGLVRLSGAAAMRLRSIGGGPAALPPRAEARSAGGRLIWDLGDPGWRALGVAPVLALAITRPTPSLDMWGFALIDAAPARRAAWLAAAAAGAVTLLIGLAFAVALQRRAAFARRLVVDARAKAELELRVADRTTELTAEIAERRATEARLRAAQDDLVQAGKLSALGRMAAGLAHELNQPLAAIRGFADNAAVFLDRGREGEARANLSRIADLTERTAQIIRHLRAFARNAPERAGPTDMQAVVEGALALLEARLKQSGARVAWSPPTRPIVALGGLVRLQQVVVNLVANALDAQHDHSAPEIAVALSEEGGRVRLSIGDRGPGLPEDAAGRIFDPFFSTKADGDGGMGLGLSISYRIVKAFEGELRAGPRPGGGAVFTIDLAGVEAGAGTGAAAA